MTYRYSLRPIIMFDNENDNLYYQMEEKHSDDCYAKLDSNNWIFETRKEAVETLKIMIQDLETEIKERDKISKTYKEIFNDMFDNAVDFATKSSDGFNPQRAHEKAYCEAIDMVKSPKHYKFFDMEVIEVIKASMTDEQFVGYCKGNAIKYRLRAGKKDDTLQDIAKAEEYEIMYSKFITS